MQSTAGSNAPTRRGDVEAAPLSVWKAVPSPSMSARSKVTRDFGESSAPSLGLSTEPGGGRSPPQLRSRASPLVPRRSTDANRSSPQVGDALFGQPGGPELTSFKKGGSDVAPKGSSEGPSPSSKPAGGFGSVSVMPLAAVRPKDAPKKKEDLDFDVVASWLPLVLSQAEDVVETFKTHRIDERVLRTLTEDDLLLQLRLSPESCRAILAGIALLK